MGDAGWPWQAIVAAVWNLAVVAMGITAFVVLGFGIGPADGAEGTGAAFGRALAFFILVFLSVAGLPFLVVRLLAGILLLKRRNAGRVLAIIGSCVGLAFTLWLVLVSSGKALPLFALEVAVFVLLLQAPTRDWIRQRPA